MRPTKSDHGEYCPAVHRDPEILGGVPVFVGTRVPVQNLFDDLAGGDCLDDFLRSFPTVSREQAVSALNEAGEALKSLAHAAR
ncbi:MAG TPA: DUF433 domain-containing protein [Longimicrobium sp.]